VFVEGASSLTRDDEHWPQTLALRQRMFQGGIMASTDPIRVIGLPGPVDRPPHGVRVPRSVAVDNAELIRGERERVARELHDVALGRLSRIGFELSMVTAINQPPVSSRSRDLVDERIQSVMEDVDALIGELRNMVFDLLGRRDSDLDIETVLRRLVEDAAAQMGIEVDLSIDGRVGAMPPSIAHHVPAVAREALRNAVLHSGASHVAAALIVGEDAVELSVTDDGVGPPAGPAHGLGLGSMTARARELHGTLTFGPGVGGGTVLRWRVPC
jgi:signal transduction histidine kinase